MARNVEIKAQIDRVEALEPTVIVQDDSFFHSARGGLKLRESAHGSAELIACGQRGRVRQQRTLYLIGATRVHLDGVDGRGHFVELEVVPRDTQGTSQSEALARDLLVAVGLDSAPLIAGANIDPLELKEASR